MKHVDDFGMASILGEIAGAFPLQILCIRKTGPLQ